MPHEARKVILWPVAVRSLAKAWERLRLLSVDMALTKEDIEALRHLFREEVPTREEFQELRGELKGVD